MAGAATRRSPAEHRFVGPDGRSPGPARVGLPCGDATPTGRGAG